jgi:polyferredoxin
MSSSTTSSSGFTQAAHNTTWQVWAACAAILAGTVLGGVALIEWIWPLFWAAVGVVVVGSIAAAAAGIMNEVSEYGATGE